MECITEEYGFPPKKGKKTALVEIKSSATLEDHKTHGKKEKH